MAIYKMASLVISAQEEHAGSPCSQAIAAFEPRDDFGISIRAGGGLTAEAICHPVLALRIILAGPVRNAVLLLVFNHLLDVETNMAKNPRSEL